MRDLVRQFQSGAGLRDSRNEIVVGEVIRAMARLGCPALVFRIHEDQQQLRFRTASRSDLSTVTVTVARPAGSGALSEAMFGNQVQLTVVAERRETLSAPGELLAAARRRPRTIDGNIHVDRELLSLLARTTRTVDLDQQHGVPQPGDAPLAALMEETIDALAQALVTYCADAPA